MRIYRRLLTPFLIVASLAGAAQAAPVVDPDKTYDLAVPAGWHVVASTRPHRVTLRSASGGLTVISYVAHSDTSVSDAGIRTYEREIAKKLPGIKWGKASSTTVSGAPAKRVECELKGTPLTYVLIPKGGHLWLITVATKTRADSDNLLKPLLPGLHLH